MNQPCIYVLKSPVDDQVMYVGKSVNPELRLEQHIAEAKQDRPNPKAQWIRALLSRSLFPVIEVIERCDEHQWQTREAFWINYYKSVNSELRNSAPQRREGEREPNGSSIVFRLKEVAESKGINRHQLSMLIGVSYPTILKYWRNENTAFDTSILDKLCEVLDCEPCDLIVRHR